MDMENLIGLAVVILIGLIVITKIIMDGRIKEKLIEQGKLDEAIKKKTKKHPISYLKWVLLAVIFWLLIALRSVFPNLISPETLMMLLIIFPIAGIIVYYLMAKKEFEKTRSIGTNTDKE